MGNKMGQVERVTRTMRERENIQEDEVVRNSEMDDKTRMQEG